jgi:hypothetical protein
MATLQEHQAADFIRTLNEFGRSVVIDGEELRGFTRNLDTSAGRSGRDSSPGSFFGVSVIRQAYWFLPGALGPLPPSGAELVIDGIPWTVEQAISGPVNDHLIVKRNIA